MIHGVIERFENRLNFHLGIHTTWFRISGFEAFPINGQITEPTDLWAAGITVKEPESEREVVLAFAIPHHPKIADRVNLELRVPAAGFVYAPRYGRPSQYVHRSDWLELEHRFKLVTCSDINVAMREAVFTFMAR